MAAPRRRARVAVIGAGPAGLAVARELLREGHSVTVFEAGSGVGGAWHFDSSTDSDLLGLSGARVHSSMYAGLRTNLPRHTMSFLDLPFVPAAMAGRSRDPRTYPGHAEVLAYLQAYADVFDLTRHIRLNTRVLRLDPAPCKATTATCSSSNPATLSAEAPAAASDEAAAPGSWQHIGWRVASQAQQAGQACAAVEEEVFDAVASCCGIFSEPNLPQVPGMAGWLGLQLHSHNFRGSHQFKGMSKVLVVGASFSGEEIARTIAGEVAHVFHSARTFTGPGTAREPPLAKQQQAHMPAPSPAATSSPGAAIPAANEPQPNITRVPMLEQLLPDGSAVFGGGLVVAGLQAVVFATGYCYRFPWLEHLGLVNTTGSHVRPLWLHMFPPSAAPSLALIGLPWRCAKLPQFQLQGQLLARLLSGRATLPPREEMLQEQQQLFQAMAAAGIPRRYTHCMASFMPCDEWRYAAALCSCAGGPAPIDLLVMPAWLRRLAVAVGGNILGRPDTFRDCWCPEVQQLLQEADVAAAKLVAALAKQQAACRRDQQGSGGETKEP